MARPVAADAQATRARILQSALRLVADSGIEGTSIRGVAAGAKVSLATVLHYYGSKAGLYQACIDSMYTELEQLRAALFAAIRVATSAPPRRQRPPKSVAGLLGDTVRAAVIFTRQHRTAHRILLRAVVDEGGMRADRREKFLRPFLDDITALLTPLLGAPAARVRMTAQSIVDLSVRYSLHNAAELRIITGHDDDDDARAAVEAHLVDLAQAMLLPAPR